MNTASQYSILGALTILLLVAGNTNAQKGLMERKVVDGQLEGEVINKVEQQLIEAAELLQVMQEGGGSSFPLQMPKFAEKRRNKFEFIRFGRR